MASIKNFGIQGVGSDVQFGKGGNRLVSEGNVFRVVNSANAAVRVVVANAVADTDAIALGQLTSAIAPIQAELDATQLGAGLSTNGTYAPNASTSYIAAATSLADADAKIDAALKLVDTAYKAADAQIHSDVANAVSTAAAADSARQADIANAVSAISTEANARVAADTAQVTRIAALEANATQSTASLLAEIDAVEAAVGLKSDGTYLPTSGSNYTDSATTVVGAVAKLDVALHAVDVAYKAADAALASNVAAVSAALASNVAAIQANAVAQQTAIDTNTAGIASEVTRAQGAESDLSTRVTNEVTRATAAESALANSVYIETVRAQGAESTISNTVTAEVARATAAEAAIANTVTTEVNRAMGVEGNLQSQIANLAANVTSLGNVFNYKGSLDGSSTNLDSVDANPHAGDYFKVTSANAVTFTYNSGASSITLNPNDGLVRNTTGGWDKIDNTDSTVSGTTNFVSVTGSTDTGFVVDLASSVKSRINAVEANTTIAATVLQAEIDSLTANVANSFARVDGVDAAQNAALALEANARSAADTQNAQAISNEANARTAADTLFTNNLANTVAAYQAADAAITSNLANTVTAYQAADAALQTELDHTQTGAGLAADGSYVVNGSANYISNATSLANADTKLDAAIKAVATGLSNLSQDAIVSTGKKYEVKTTDGDVEFLANLAGSGFAVVGNVVTAAAQDSTFSLSTATAGQVRLEAHSSTSANVDIRLVPQGNGQVVVGEQGTNGVIQAEDGFNLTLQGGDQGSAAQAGDLVLHAGAGSVNGSVVVKDGSGNVVLKATSGNAATNALISGSATAVTFAADGSAANVDVVLAPKGTGNVDASSHKIVNVSAGTAATDAVNKSQLDSAVATAQTAATSGSHRSVSASITEVAGPVALGSVNGTAVRVKVVVTAGFSAGAQITVGTSANNAELVASSDVDESAAGMYIVELAKDYSNTALNVYVTVGSGSTGAAKVYLEYISA
jgi:hypothetical protein